MDAALPFLTGGPGCRRRARAAAITVFPGKNRDAHTAVHAVRRITSVSYRAPGIAGLSASGALPGGAHLAPVTGKVLCIDSAAINPHGAAGNGVVPAEL